MATKEITCRDCPNFMTDETDAIRKRFGKSTGSAMCSMYGYVLSRPGHEYSEVLVDFASKCSSYGKAPSVKAVSITPRVVNPDPAILAAGETHQACSTCYACDNLISQDAVLTKYGWPLPICSAKGTLVFSPSREAQGCMWAKPGKAKADFPPDVDLIPQFRVGFRVNDQIKLQQILGDTAIIDPAAYVSDVAVSSDDKANGIRAWRKFTDPGTKNEYFLPIFERDFFTPEEQLRIPQTGVEFFRYGKPELYVDYMGITMEFLKNSYALDYTLALEGEAGNGKTLFGVFLAWLMQVPFEKFSITPDMNVEAFVGHPDIADGKTFFAPGRLPRAFQRPGIGISDEFTSGPDEVFFVYRGIFDMGVINIDYQDGMMIRKHDYFFHIVTANPSWDMRNIGTRELSDADAQRLNFIWVEEPPESVLRFMLKRHCGEDDYDITDETIDKIIKIRGDIRNLSEQGIYPGTWGTRQDLKVARLSAQYADLVDAYRRAALDHIPPDARKIVLQSIQDMDDDISSDTGEVPF